MFQKLSKMLKIYKFAAAAKLKDGTDIFIDGDLSAGTKVYVVTSEGNLEMPDGSYELEDGLTIVIEEGVITEVKEPVEEPEGEEEEVEAKEDPEKEVKAEEETPAQEPEKETETDEISEKIFNKLNDLLSRIEKIEKSNTDLSKINQEMKTQNENFSKQIDEFKTKLEKMPGAEPIKKRVEEKSTTITPNKRLQVLKNLNG